LQSRYGYTALDLPTLVHAFGAHTGIGYYDDDHWVVSVRNASGRECGIFDFVYDRANHRIRFSSFGLILPQDPRSTKPFPYISPASAMAELQSERKLAPLSGAQPELVFFPIDPRYRDPSSPVKWFGGGEAPDDPTWLIVGSDGQSYFVGHDMRVHSLQEVPIAVGQP
jgi:hypothetical protein